VNLSAGPRGRGVWALDGVSSRCRMGASSVFHVRAYPRAERSLFPAWRGSVYPSVTLPGRAVPVLPLPFVAAFLLLAGLWWTLAGVAWVAWTRRFRSPGSRDEARARRAIGKGGVDLLDLVAFTVPVIAPVALAFDGLFGGRVLLYGPAVSIVLPAPEILQLLGVVLLLLGLPLFTWTSYLTARYVDSKLPGERTLLRHGPYRWVRHPMYLSFLLIAAGYVLLAQHFLALLGLSLVANLKGLAKEEAELGRLFGDAHRDYCRRTGALFPKLRRGS